MVGLTLKYYDEIPPLFEGLFASGRVEATHEQKTRYLLKVRRRFEGRRCQLVSLVLTLALNGVYFYQILRGHELGWMLGGDLLKGCLASPNGFKPFGLFAALVQITLIYWVLMLIWRAILFAWSLHELFNREGFVIALHPMHADGCGGLKGINDVAMNLNYILLALGIYVSLKVVDKMMMQHQSLFQDIGNPMMLTVFVILGPLLFFAPLAAPHNAMKEYKHKMINPVGDRMLKSLTAIRLAQTPDDLFKEIGAYKELDVIRQGLMSSIPVWPFHFRSIEVFLGTIVTPLLPTVISLVFSLLGGGQ